MPRRSAINSINIRMGKNRAYAGGSTEQLVNAGTALGNLYVVAVLPQNPDERSPRLGFIHILPH